LGSPLTRKNDERFYAQVLLIGITMYLFIIPYTPIFV